MKALVTGGAGFIGSHIADLLIENNYEVCIIDNLVKGRMCNLNAQAAFYKMDIRDKDIADIFNEEKPDVILHNAAQVSMADSIKDPYNDASVNITGTINILEAARKTNIRKIIYSNSAGIFGEPKYLPIDEKHPRDMQCGYGISKHTVEHYLRIYKELYNIDYISLIYSNVYGPRQNSDGEGGAIALFINRMISGLSPVIYGDGEQTRDFVYVKDVAKANLAAVQYDKCDIFNVSTGQKISINQLVLLLNALLNKNIAAVYSGERKWDIKNSFMSYDKIYKKTGWKPQYSIYEGLKETLEYYIIKAMA